MTNGQHIDSDAIYNRQDIKQVLGIGDTTFSKIIKLIQHKKSGGRYYCTGRQLLEYLESTEPEIKTISKAMEKVNRLIAIK